MIAYIGNPCCNVIELFEHSHRHSSRLKMHRLGRRSLEISEDSDVEDGSHVKEAESKVTNLNREQTIEPRGAIVEQKQTHEG